MFDDLHTKRCPRPRRRRLSTGQPCRPTKGCCGGTRSGGGAMMPLLGSLHVDTGEDGTTGRVQNAGPARAGEWVPLLPRNRIFIFERGGVSKGWK
ncbi:hypothetical protein QJS04_geneDACA007413 [Acorus gramineus]|uniref:Uncharacterized protein n=1 Tax=Acorus gramineus TaxID=55184 RepID=A0AAV9BPD4_ACOGR|nr:hypothetical protein QJS04_geneDACA007413 [Acorus gramineus]